MLRYLIGAVGACMTIHCAAADKAPEVHDLTQDFVAFWDASRTLPTDARVAQFKLTVAPRFPEFYGIERYAGQRTQEQQDKIIGTAIEKFDGIRDAYVNKAKAFGHELPRHIATFQHTFPDFKLDTPIYLLHSMGEMDGGTRDLAGRTRLIFGADGMVLYHGNGNEAAFFHHELFHIHHQAKMPDCAGTGLWQPLWQEGLATYVSHTMNPQANHKELLLTFPAGMVERTQAQLGASLAHLEQVLDVSDDLLYGEMFQSMNKETKGLPARRGYYLGYLVAAEAGKTRKLSELAQLSCADARALVGATVQQLRKHAK